MQPAEAAREERQATDGLIGPSWSAEVADIFRDHDAAWRDANPHMRSVLIHPIASEPMCVLTPDALARFNHYRHRAGTAGRWLRAHIATMVLRR